MAKVNSITIQPAKALRGEIEAASDKSISHRAVILGSLSEGVTHVQHFLEGEDCLATVAAFQQMGVQIEHPKPGELIIHGVGLHGLKAPQKAIDCGNSGTTMRLMLGVLAGQNFDSELTGDDSLVKRPMRRVVEPLRLMGAKIEGKDNGNFAPLKITGQKLKGILFEEKLGSAQVKSAILLAGLFAEGTTCLNELVISRDHTERMLKEFGVGEGFLVEPIGKRTRSYQLCIKPPIVLKGKEFSIPGDVSSASFFIVAGLIVPGSDVTIKNIGLNPTRTGLLTTLQRMMPEDKKDKFLNFNTAKDLMKEPVGDLHVNYRELKPVKNRVLAPIPFLIDEVPILMVACARAKGISHIKGIHELRVKETDRIKSMATNLKKLGVKVQEGEDEVMIEGTTQPFRGGVELESFGDHRTAMSCAVAALCADKAVTIRDINCVKTSFPNFFDLLEQLRK